MGKYFDYNATTPVAQKVLEAMLPYFSIRYGNPSSQHKPGKEAALAVKKAREAIADCLKVNPDELVFTSSGTEANNTAIKVVAYAAKHRGCHLITTLSEHHSVLNTMRELENEGFEVTYLPLENSGVVNLDALKRALRDDTVMVSIMAVNNETGVIQPLKETGRILGDKPVVFHSDMVQALGKTPLDLSGWRVDLASFSAHKIYGPKGMGLLYAKRGIQLWPIIHGGSQENRRRAGTENVPSIIGFSSAVRRILANREEVWAKQAEARDRLENFLRQVHPALIVNGEAAKRVNNTSNFIIPGVNGKRLVSDLSKIGYYIASGAACASKQTEPSHVLLAMGIKPELALGAVRISLGIDISVSEIKKLGSVISDCAK